MIRFVFVVLCFFCLHASSQPTYLIGKSFAEKWKYIDSLNKKLELNNPSEAILKINELETWADEHGDNELAGEFALLRYRRKTETTNLVVQEQKLKDLITSAHQNKQEYLEADALNALGRYYWDNFQKQEIAFDNYIASYKIYSKFTPDEFPSKQEYLFVLGGAYLRYGDIDNAIKYLSEAAATKPGNSDTYYYTICNSLGMCYRKILRFDSSDWYFRKTYNVALKNRDTIWLGISGGNIGTNYYLQKKYTEAVPLLEKDIEISLAHNVVENAAGSMHTLASIYFYENQFDSCENLLLKALNICQVKPFWPNYELQEQIYTLLYKAYAARDNMRLAYIYADSALMAKDSVVTRFNALSLAKAQEKSDFIENKLQDEQLQISQLELAKKRNEVIFFIVGILLMMAVIVIMIRNYRLLAAEKLKSEKLLLNILPAEVAEELKEKGTARAHQYDDVTVLFTDFTNFTEAGERMTPQELVNELHTCFKTFDEILKKHNIEKIKTVGDAYLAVSGLPAANPTHATDVVAAAIEIRDFMQARMAELGNATFGIRIGIHSGSVVAGIVGVSKFSYDIWGDTVNTAARMEQNSTPGKINISEATFRLVGNRYECHHRGKINVKNKGIIDMYFVEAH